MKTFLGVIGVFSWILAGVMAYQGFSIYNVATTIMQQSLGMQYIMFGGILFIAGIIGLGFSIGNGDK